MQGKEKEDLEALKKRAEYALFRTRESQIKEILILAEQVGKFIKIVEHDGEYYYELATHHNLTDAEKISLVLCAKLLGSYIREDFDVIASLKEISEATGIEQKVASARLSELVEKDFAKREGKGLFKVKSIKACEQLIESLKAKYEKE